MLCWFLLYDPVNPVPGMYLEKTTIQKDVCTPVFIATLFTITRTWQQSKHPSTEEWVKMWHIYTMLYDPFRFCGLFWWVFWVFVFCFCL